MRDSRIPDEQCKPNSGSTKQTRCDGLDEGKGARMQIARNERRKKQCDARKKSKRTELEKVWSTSLPKCSSFDHRHAQPTGLHSKKH